MISRLKEEEVTGSWRKMHNKKLHDFYTSNLNDKRPHGRPIHWWGNDIKIDLKMYMKAQTGFI
jgi:hypothetical protein